MPPEYYSFFRNPRPASYELGVYGPTEDFSRYGDPRALKPNEWAIVPQGVWIMAGQVYETAKTSKKKYEEAVARTYANGGSK